MQVKVEQGCIGCGLCVSICPAVFKMGENETAVVACQPAGANVDDAENAASQCPVGVIKTED